MDYARYETLRIARRGPDDTVLDIQMKAANGKLPTAGHAGHRELAEIWRDVSADEAPPGNGRHRRRFDLRCNLPSLPPLFSHSDLPCAAKFSSWMTIGRFAT